MAESQSEYIGVKDVSFTPTGGDAIVFQLVGDGDGVEDSVNVTQIRHKTPSGKYQRFVHTTLVERTVMVNTKALNIIADNAANLAVDTEGTLTYTLIGAGLESDLDKVVSSAAKIIEPTPYTGTDGDSPSQGRIGFLLTSSDGTTDPMSVTDAA